MADPAPQSPGSEVPAPKQSPGKVLDEPKLNGTKINGGPNENSTKAENEEQLDSSSEPGPDEDSEVASDAVVCDSCMDAPRAALKSCLTCLVSYCEVHLRPHLENPKFSQHRLVEPLRDIERKTCELHHEGLDWFCVADRTCVCGGCVQEEHRGHELKSVEQARRDIERELKQKQSEMGKTVAAAENAISKLQHNTVSIENSVSEARSVVDAQFEVLTGAVERTKRALVEVLEAEEKQAVQQADGIRVHLENRLSDLRKTQAQVQKISRNKNHLDFLQDYSAWKADASDTTLPGVYIGLMDSLNSFSKIIIESTEKLCSTMDSEFTERVKRACSNDTSGLGIKTTVRSIIAAKHNQNLPEPQSRAELLQYAKSFTFDANTAHKFLRLTEENRKATNTTPWQHAYAEHAERFEHWRQVLGAESIYLDRAYYELQLNGDGIYLGLAYKSLDRKSNESNSCICSTNAAWCVQVSGKSFSAWHSDVETPLTSAQTRFSLFGVYVDHAGGRLRFYGLRAGGGDGDGDGSLALLHEFKADFREPLYPAFYLPKKENAVTMATPGEPLKSTSSPPSSPPTTPPTSALTTPTNVTANENANNNNNAMDSASKSTTTATSTANTCTTTANSVCSSHSTDGD